jgi:hypothetical protein
MTYGIVRSDIVSYSNWLSRYFRGNGNQFLRSVIYIPVSTVFQNKMPRSEIIEF